MTCVLLTPESIHRYGDEMWDGAAWVPVPRLHWGDAVGEESPPCRRAVQPDPVFREWMEHYTA